MDNHYILASLVSEMQCLREQQAGRTARGSHLLELPFKFKVSDA